MPKQNAVRLPDELYQRLRTLAGQTGRTAAFYVREAVLEYLDDLEDIFTLPKMFWRSSAKV